MSWQEADGSRRVFGLVDLRIIDAGEHRTFAGTVTDLATVGFSVIANGDETSFSAGYTRAVMAMLRDNALVIGNPLLVGQLMEEGLRHAK